MFERLVAVAHDDAQRATDAQIELHFGRDDVTGAHPLGHALGIGPLGEELLRRGAEPAPHHELAVAHRRLAFLAAMRRSSASSLPSHAWRIPSIQAEALRSALPLRLQRRSRP